MKAPECTCQCKAHAPIVIKVDGKKTTELLSDAEREKKNRRRK